MKPGPFSLNRTAWCKAKEFGCECGRPDTEPCPLPHPRAATMSCACRFVLHDGWLLLNPETECGYHRALREDREGPSEEELRKRAFNKLQPGEA